MIKLSASVSRKVPVPNLEFSSQSFHGGVEVEVSDGASEEQIRERLGALYALLDGAVQAEIAKAESRAAQPAKPPSPPQPKASGTGQPQPSQPVTSRVAKATTAQVKAVFGIAKGQGIAREALFAMLAEQYAGISKPEDLTVSQASEFIQKLKGNGQH